MTDVIPTQMPPRSAARSILAVFLGVLAVFVLSLGTDQIMHILGVFPPWGQPMHDAGDNLLALSYRILYGIVGGYVAASFAPRKPLGHAIVLGLVGTVLSLLGALGAMSMDMGPIWYPVALVVTALPCAWLGGFLHHRMQY
jgi:hypothetical protein